MKKNEIIKLILSITALSALLIFSYKKNEEYLAIDPHKVIFETNIGHKSIEAFYGKKTLLYFGFLSCPEACPTTMAKVSKVFKKLSPEELAKIQLIFVDIDPERDQILKIKEYLHYFFPDFIAFKIADQNLLALKQFARYYGVNFIKKQIPGSTLNYTLDHSVNIVVLDEQGKIISSISHDITLDLLTTTILNLIHH